MAKDYTREHAEHAEERENGGIPRPQATDPTDVYGGGPLGTPCIDSDRRIWRLWAKGGR